MWLKDSRTRIVPLLFAAGISPDLRRVDDWKHGIQGTILQGGPDLMLR